MRDARVATATSTVGSRHSRRKEQAPRRASSWIASQRSQTPSGAPPSGIEVIRTGITQTVAPPPVSSQDGASQEVKAVVQDIVKSSLTQLGDFTGHPYSVWMTQLDFRQMKPFPLSVGSLIMVAPEPVLADNLPYLSNSGFIRNVI